MNRQTQFHSFTFSSGVYYHCTKEEKKITKLFFFPGCKDRSFQRWLVLLLGGKLIPVQWDICSALQVRQAWVTTGHQSSGKHLLSLGQFSYPARKAGQHSWALLRFGLITHTIGAETRCCRDRRRESVKFLCNPPAPMMTFVFEGLLSFECNIS